MPDDNQNTDAPQTEQQEDDALLANMEQQLHDMRGDDSYDDVDSLDDAADTLDQRADENEQTQEEGAEETAEQERAEEGKPAATEEAGTEAKPEDTDGDAEGELTPEDRDKEDDEIHAAITNEKTAARFQQFREENKQMSGEMEQLNSQYEELKAASGTLFDYLDESQTTPEQLSAQLALNKAINTGDFQAARPAYERMKEMMRLVAVGLGDAELAQVDLPPDLQQKVDNLDITPDMAQEHARLQAQQALQAQYQQRGQQQQQVIQQDVQAKQQAAADIKQWEDALRTSDPDFAGKQAQMLANAKHIMSTTPANQWLPALQQQYSIITDTQARVAQQLAAQKQRAPAPLRPGAHSSGGAMPAPKSFEENFNQRLRSMRPDAQ